MAGINGNNTDWMVNLTKDKIDAVKSKLFVLKSLQTTDLNMRKKALSMILSQSQAFDQDLLPVFILQLARLRFACPFEDVRRTLDEYFAKHPEFHVDVEYAISRFVKIEKFPPLKCSIPMVKDFITTGRISNFSRVISFFEKYHAGFLDTFGELMYGSGPLPFHIRHYVGLMASGQYKSHYLISLGQFEFLMNGGNPQWLKGIEYAPPKIQDLGKLVNLLAFQPWKVRTAHIAELTRNSKLWSMSELVHAIVIITTYYLLSSMSFGCGINPEVDFAFGKSGVEREPQADTTDNQDLVKVLKGYNLNQGSENKIEFERCASSCECILGESDTLLPNYSTFNLKHEDFDVRSSEYSILRVQDFSWEDHGCPFVANYLPKISELLDSEFQTALEMTDNSVYFMSGQGVDTWPFRQAVWYYSLRLTGTCHDDYDYQQVNILLNKTIKSFIKKLSCFPRQISFNDFENFGFQLRDEEKFHVNILAVEARRQAQLVYAIKAIIEMSER